MNKDLDLTKILKDCPNGTKFHSKCFGELTFDCIINDRICLKDYSKFNRIYEKNGKYVYCDETAEIDLLPSKNQRDWSKWHIPFKDGDVVTYKLKGSLVAFIYKERTTTTLVKSHFALYIQNMGFCIDGDIALKEEDIVFATEEEKQKLFEAIKANGYKWNDETKTLEKLVVPKFKVGDRIKHRLTGDVYKVVFILSNECGGGAYDVAITNEIGKSIDIEEQDNYELVPNKFDPKTLQPFDKALVRIDSDDNWYAVFFSHIEDINGEKFVTTAGMCYKQMIPYNNDTKHLLGTNNEAPEYYKYWED